MNMPKASEGIPASIERFDDNYVERSFFAIS